MLITFFGRTLTGTAKSLLGHNVSKENVLRAMYVGANLSQVRYAGTSARPLVPFGVRNSPSYKDAKVSARKSAVKARRLEEEKGLLLDPRKVLMMELKRNTGIGWYRSLQVIKHLEMHKNGKGPPIDTRMRDKISRIVNDLKKGK